MSKTLKSRKHRYSLFPIRWLLVAYDILIYATVVVFALIFFPRSGGRPLENPQEALDVLIHFAISITAGME